MVCARKARCEFDIDGPGYVVQSTIRRSFIQLAFTQLRPITFSSGTRRNQSFSAQDPADRFSKHRNTPAATARWRWMRVAANGTNHPVELPPNASHWKLE